MVKSSGSGDPAPGFGGHDIVVGILLLVSIAGGAGFAAAYVVDGGTQLLGISLAVAAVALGIAIALWAKNFMPQGPFAEDRPVLQSTRKERALVAADFDRGERTVLRRRMLTLLLVGAVGTMGAAALFPLRSLGRWPVPDLRRTPWKKGRRLVDEAGEPVALDRLDVDSVLTVFPEGITEAEKEDSQTLLLRVGAGVLTTEPGRETWTPAGYVAFSKVCTHAGCPVGLYQAETHQLVCPCHQSLFDVTSGATPVFGPATRPLPQLPLGIEDGFLVAQGDFPEPVGPGFWSLGEPGGDDAADAGTGSASGDDG